MLWRKAIMLLREDAVAGLVGSLANSALYIFSNNPLCSSKRSMVSPSKCASVCILLTSVLYALSAPNVRGNLLDSSYAGLSDLPHSRQQVLRRDVINPQNGRILCERKSGSTGLRVASSFVNESVMKARFL